MKEGTSSKDRLAALKIVSVYSVIAALWIYFSDNAMGAFVRDPSFMVRTSLLKGSLFVVVTSTVLYQLIVSYVRSSRHMRDELKISGNLVNALIDSATDAIFIKDLVGRYLLFNSGAEKLTGKEAIEVIGKDDRALFSPADARALMERDRQVMDGGKVTTVEERMEMADGSYRTFLATKGPIFDEGGKVIGLFGISRDISDRKQAEEARESTLELLRLCYGATELRELMRALINYFQRVTGCESVGVRLREDDDFPYYETRGFEEQFVLMESSLCAKDAEGNVIRDSLDQPVLGCMCGNVLRGRFDPSKSFFTPRGSFWTNSTSELLATTTEADRQSETRNRCNGEGYESVALLPIRTKDETLGLFQFNDKRKGRFTKENIALLEDLVGYVAIALAKLKADGALKESEQNFRELSTQFLALLDAIPDSITIQTPDLKVLWANKSAVAGLSDGTADPAGRLCYSLWRQRNSPCDPCPALNSFRTGESDLKIVETQDGKTWELRTLPVKTPEGVVSVIEVARDVTEHRELEKQLRQAQKMEAVGQLAGGIAHDFNNILSTIIGYAHLIHEELSEDDPLRINTSEILEASQRATQVTHSLLAFSRKQVVNLKPVDLNVIILRVQNLLRRLIGEDVNFNVTLTYGSLDVVADSGQIEQALMNLAMNARDAMPEGGNLTIDSGLTEIDDGFILSHGYGKHGAYAYITVSDTGAGMDEATRSRIFEPFFTTKEQGRGTGLGLAMVYGIVKQHNGYISVHSSPGNGTTFRMYLPLISVRSVGEETQALHPPARSREGKETILVAEDDAALRKLSTVVLTASGYKVITAEDGEDAVEKFRSHKGEIRLLILDMVMPKKSGKDVYQEITRMTPRIKAIFVSGYTADKVRSDDLVEGTEFILKPVSPRDLLKRVRDVLDRTDT